MHKFKRTKLLSLLCLTLTFTACGVNDEVIEKEMEQKKPNILMIVADDLGYGDIGAYGSEISTPNLDKLIDEGMQFTNFHVSATCAPTRGMLLTGADNHVIGMGNMIEIMADNQFDQPGYESYLNDKAVAVSSMLNENDYRTYMAGKWHLGKETLPVNSGFDKSVALLESGADNWEKKSYLPAYEKVHYFEDDHEIDLPDDFYSSDFYADKLIEYIDSDKDSENPFFGYLSFQAVHYPHQAPEELTQKYIELYENGWDEIKEARLSRMVDLGIIDEDTKIVEQAKVRSWDSLTDEEKNIQLNRWLFTQVC